MPASSQASPTSGMRSTSALHSSQRIVTASIHGRWSSWSWLQPGRRALLELRPRADHVQMATAARVERQRQPGVAFPRDVPVAHVPQPVVHPLRVERRSPLDRAVGLEHRAANLVGRNEPVVDDAEHERRLAAPADRISMDDPACVDQEPALAQRRDHRLLDLVGAERGERPVPLVEPTALVDRNEHRQLVDARELEVLRPGPGAMWTMPVPSASETSSQGITRCATVSGTSPSNGPSYSSPTSSEPRAVRANAASGMRSTAHHSPSAVRP